MVDETTKVLVVDNGSGVVRAGFAGEQVPRATFPSIVGGSSSKNTEWVVGDEARNYSLFTIYHPIYRGVVTDWGLMEKIWHHTFYSKLRIAPEEHSVLLTEPSLNPRAARERITQIMFEVFDVRGMYVCSQAALSLFASGRVDGVVLEIGDGVTQAIPMYEGYALPHAMRQIHLAGRDLTNNMMKLLTERGYSFVTTISREIARDIKEKLCFVAKDFNQEIKKSNNTDIKKSYELPSGDVITIDTERFRCPEVLFRPSLIGMEEVGIHELVGSAIHASDIELQPMFHKNIVLSGGTSLLEGLEDRLLEELSEWLNKGNRSKSRLDLDGVKIYAPKERDISVWLGGSILASLSTFEFMWIKKEDYECSGPAIVHSKCVN
mmetsp:Transcript_12702/g.14439  ORF Transcript_12702/g.14439 Transcript_12702/m.14439 type:complete len:378 (+) Transcript_12702:230-1363(+)